MKRVTITMMTVILVVGLAELSLSQFYYGGGREIPLGIDSTKVVLRFHDNVTELEGQQVLASIDRVVGVVDDSNTGRKDQPG